MSIYTDFLLRRRKAVKNHSTCVYAYLCASTRKPYYVGVSTGTSRVIDQKNHRKHGVSVPKDRTKIVFLRGQLTKAEAGDWERFYIKHYGRRDLGTGILINRSAGGEGEQELSDETRAKISAASKGKKLSESHLATLAEISRLPKTEEHKRRISDGQPSKGGTHKPAHLEALRTIYAQRRADNAAAKGMTLQEHDADVKANAKAALQRCKQQNRQEALQLGMTKRSHEAWKKAGCPSDHRPFLRKNKLPNTHG